MRRPSVLTAVILVPLVLAACSGAEWHPTDDVTIARTGISRESINALPDVRWSGELVEVSGCIGVAVGDLPPFVAVFYDDDETVKNEAGALGVRLADGDVLEVGTRYAGHTSPLEDLEALARYDHGVECAEMLGTTKGTVIHTADGDPDI